MASSYPGGLDSFPTNRSNATPMLDNQPADHNNYADAINKIEATLGVDPQGSFDTVVERLDNGGSQPGAVRRLTVDVTAEDLAEGPITLYATAAGEVVGPVYLYDVVFCNSSTTITIGRDEQVPGDTELPALAGWDSDLCKDGVGQAVADSSLKHVPLTTGPVTAGFTDGDLSLLHLAAWQAGHVYSQFDHIIAAGHIWEADPGGTSGGSEPDFEGNIGGTVADNGITWTDYADATVGSATVSFDVCIPVAP